jgi:hypothetical protein
VTSALEALEPLFFNNMTLVLDRYFVRRLRVVTGKDGNALNEVELMSDSLMNNDGVLRSNNVIELIPDQSVLKLDIGGRIRLSAAQFQYLSIGVPRRDRGQVRSMSAGYRRQPFAEESRGIRSVLPNGVLRRSAAGVHPYIVRPS